MSKLTITFGDFIKESSCICRFCCLLKRSFTCDLTAGNVQIAYCEQLYECRVFNLSTCCFAKPKSKFIWTTKDKVLLILAVIWLDFMQYSRWKEQDNNSNNFKKTNNVKCYCLLDLVQKNYLLSVIIKFSLSLSFIMRNIETFW